MGTCQGCDWFTHVNGVWQLIFEVHDGFVMLYGGGCGVLPIGGGVVCVYNGYRGHYGEGGHVFGKVIHNSLPWILFRA